MSSKCWFHWGHGPNSNATPDVDGTRQKKPNLDNLPAASEVYPASTLVEEFSSPVLMATLPEVTKLGESATT